MFTLKRPLLRYHGGKFTLAAWVLSQFPPHRVYTETYGGAASVLLQKKRAYAEAYSDMDGELVNLFLTVRERGQELRRALELTPFSRAEFELSYKPSGDPLEQARRTVVRSFQGHGSNSHAVRTGFRADSTRAGSIPAHDWASYPKHLDAAIKRLQGVIIENRPAADVLRQHDSKETLHYVDPPYPAGTRNKGADYRHELDDEGHRELAAVLHACRGMVVLSGYACPLYDELYGDWQAVTRETQADGGGDRVEVLWLNPAAWARQNRQLQFPI